MLWSSAGLQLGIVIELHERGYIDMLKKTISKLNRKTNGHDLITQRDMRIRNRMIIILLLPATIVLWLIGWLLYSSPPSSRPESRDTRETVKLVDTIFEEEKQEILQKRS